LGVEEDDPSVVRLVAGGVEGGEQGPSEGVRAEDVEAPVEHDGRHAGHRVDVTARLIP